jgi:glycosyltransferase involved in cell wall biosynthesis
MTSTIKTRASLSIVCPVSNMSGRLQRLEKWVTSLQPNESIQIIIVHDCQDIPTGKELVELFSSLPNVLLIEGHYGNPGGARNAGMQLANRDWVCFWDSDDQPDVENFLEMIDEGEKNNSDICIGHFLKIDESQSKPSLENRWTEEESVNDFIFSMNPGIWRMCFRNRLIQHQQFHTFRMAEDQIFSAEAYSRADNISYFGKSVYTYFIGTNLQLTSNKVAMSDLQYSFAVMLNLLEKSPNNRSRNVISIMAARQFITGLRKMQFSIKVQLLKFFIFWIMRASNQYKLIMAHSFLKIIRNWKNYYGR